MVMNEQNNNVPMFVIRRVTVPTDKVYRLLLSPAFACHVVVQDDGNGTGLHTGMKVNLFVQTVHQ